MALIVLSAATAVILLALDAVMLTLVMKPLFITHIGPLMRDSPLPLPAAIFYLGYTAGLIYLVSWPAFRDGTPVLLPAAVLGAVAYGTYEFTSMVIMKDWSWQMVATDVIWGTVVTAFSAWAACAIVKALGYSAQ